LNKHFKAAEENKLFAEAAMLVFGLNATGFQTNSVFKRQNSH
jgi:hypothetical protein